MATRADYKDPTQLVQHFLIPSTKVVTKGMSVKFSGADNQIENCEAGDDGIGVALASGVAGDTVPVRLDGAAVIPVLVGTGTATRGLYAVTVADGHINQAIADGTTVRNLRGKFMQSGVAGDLVGLLIGCTTPTMTA